MSTSGDRNIAPVDRFNEGSREDEESERLIEEASDGSIKNPPSWSNQITNILCEMNDLITPDSREKIDQNENIKIMNISLSTIMMMASGHSAIPDAYYMWTERFLMSIKDDFGKYPPNVKNLLDFMRSRRPVVTLLRSESDGKKALKPSRIPVPIRSSNPLNASFTSIHEYSKKRCSSCLNVSNFPQFTFNSGFNKIFHRLLFPQSSLMKFTSQHEIGVNPSSIQNDKDNQID